MTEQTTGAGALVRSLEAAGADTVFGILGGAILPAYDPLRDSRRLRHVLVGHEQGAGHAAEGYALATGKVGVCVAANGAGSTNLVTPIADAYMDSVPLVAITGQVPSSSIGTDASQEADILGITLPITKHNYLVADAAEIARTLAEAFHIAATGRPGPVLVDVARDALEAATAFSWPDRVELPGYHPVTNPHTKQVREAARLLVEAHRPVLYVGGGVVRAGAQAELRVLAELTGAPVVATLTARGAFPESHRQHLGMPGIYGSVAAVAALQQADCIVALATRFDERVTGRLETFARGAGIIHADIDPAEISKNRRADIPIVGDVREVLADLVVAVQTEHSAGRSTDLGGWWSDLDGWLTKLPPGHSVPSDGSLSAPYVVEELGRIAGPDAVFVCGGGQQQMLAAQFIRRENPHTWITSSGLASRGFALPAAIGARTGRPDAVVWAVESDRSFRVTSHELAACAAQDIPIKVALLSAGNLGGSAHAQAVPDIARLVDAYGCVGLRCEKAGEVERIMAQAMAVHDVPVVIDFAVQHEAVSWPAVPPGTSAADIAAARRMAPEWDGKDGGLW